MTQDSGKLTSEEVIIQNQWNSVRAPQLAVMFCFLLLALFFNPLLSWITKIDMFSAGFNLLQKALDLPLMLTKVGINFKPLPTSGIESFGFIPLTIFQFLFILMVFFTMIGIPFFLIDFKKSYERIMNGQIISIKVLCIYISSSLATIVIYNAFESALKGLDDGWERTAFSVIFVFLAIAILFLSAHIVGDKIQDKLKSILGLNGELEPIITTAESEKSIECPIGYFQNEKGDYTITRFGEPVAVTRVERDAYNLVNTFKSLTSKIEQLNDCIEYDRNKFNEMEKEIRGLNHKLLERQK